MSFVQSFLPIRAEIDAKLGGTQCNVMLSRLMPWMRLHSLRTKAMKLSKRGSRQEISQTKEIKQILWTCTVSAPEMTVMLYSLNGLVLYHVSYLRVLIRIRPVPFVNCCLWKLACCTIFLSYVDDFLLVQTTFLC
jgi:hypothetical protein